MRLTRTSLLGIGTLLLGLSSSALAATHTVRLDGTGDFIAIQPAIDACAPGDTVLVGPGTYTGQANRDLDFRGIDLVLISESGLSQTVIDCQHAGRGIYLHSGESLNALVAGFTVRNADVEANGGGLLCRNSSCTLQTMRFEHCYSDHGGGGSVAYGSAHLVDCVFIDNHGLGTAGGLSIVYAIVALDNVLFDSNSAGSGGALRVAFSEITVSGCTFDSNLDADDGGAIALELSSQGIVSGCSFTGNQGSDGGAIALEQTPDVEIRDCVFEGNVGTRYGGAIWYESNSIAGRSEPLIEDCLFVGNTAHGGGAIGLWLNASPRITRCTLVGNGHTGWGGGGISCINASHPVIEQVLLVGNPGGGIYTWEASQPVLTCCDVWNNPGGNFTGNMVDPTGTNGNISLDPMLCSVLNPADPYTLQPASPCAPAGNECGLQIGARGVGCEVVASESRSWGEVKSLY